MGADQPQAFRWLKAGAVQGDYNSQVALSQMYELGMGVTTDLQVAAMWKSKAESNPYYLQQKARAQQEASDRQAQAQQQQAQAQQQQAMQQFLFMGLAAAIEAASQPDVYVVY